MRGSAPARLTGGLAAVFAHPDDESFGAAGALALARNAGRATRLLLVTRGEAGAPADMPIERAIRNREDELRCSARSIGLNEVTSLEGYRDGAIADAPFNDLVREIGDWLSRRKPDAVITFGAHGLTHDPDHVVVGSATRWAVQRLAAMGQGPAFVYVVAPIFGPGPTRFDLSPEEQAASHRIDITDVAERKLRALECYVSQADTKEPAAELRAAIEQGRTVYEGYRRVMPETRLPPVFEAALL